MKKDKAWLKEAVGELNLVDTVFEYDGVSYIDTAVSVNQVYDLIDQLDEPEALSQKWIDEHRKSYTMEDSVEISDLQNLLVPKQEEKNSELYGKFVEIVQMSPVSANELLDTLANLVAKQHAYGTEKPVEITEEQAWKVIHGKYGDETLQNNIDYVESQDYVVNEKPVIPQFVADWISGHHEKFDLYPALRRLEEGSTRDYDAYKWYRKNTHTFVNAYLTGEYEVEEEPKYYAKLKEVRPPEKEWLTNLTGPNYYVIDTKGLRLGEFTLDLVGLKTEASTHTLKDWERYGINDSNANFVEVAE